MKSPQGMRALSLAVSIAVATALPAVPAAASYYESGVSLTTEIIRDSVPYRLNIKAVEEMGSTYRLDVTTVQVMDPSGPTRLRQAQKWRFQLEEGEFSNGYDSYHIDAGDDAGSFRIKLDIERRDDPCSNGQRLHVVMPDDGAFRIETENETFGTITEVPVCGTSYSFATGEMPGPPACPVEGKELISSALDLEHRRVSHSVRLRINTSLERSIAGEMVRWFMKIPGTVDAPRFDLDRDLRGSFEGVGLPWLEGTAELAPRGPIERRDWYNCKGGREARTILRPVAVTGDLTVGVIGYEDYVVEDSDAIAMRSWVRERR